MTKGQVHRKLCKRWDVPFDAHFVTFSRFRRRQFLTSDRTRRWILDSISAARASAGFDLWAFVLMPEHVHLLICPHDGVQISDILWKTKQPVSRQAVQFLRRTNPAGFASMLDQLPGGLRAHRFWQTGGGYDRNMRTVSEVHEKLNYAHNNPVLRELVERAED